MANEKIFPDLSYGSTSYLYGGTDGIVYIIPEGGTSTEAFAVSTKDDTALVEELTFGIDSNSGVADESARADHTHGTPPLAGNHSVDLTSGVLTLVGDEASPATNYFYGIDSNGDRVWREIPDPSPKSVRDAGRYEVWVDDSTPPEPILTPDGTDWVYVWVDG